MGFGIQTENSVESQHCHLLPVQVLKSFLPSVKLSLLICQVVLITPTSLGYCQDQQLIYYVQKYVNKFEVFFVLWKSSMRAQDLNMYHLPGLGVCLFYFLNCSQFLLLMYSNQLFFLTFDLLPPFILQFHPPPLATTYLFCVSMTLVICFYLYIREIILYFSFLI